MIGCSHDLVEIVSLDGKTLDGAIRQCAFCHAVIGELNDVQVEAVRARAAKLVNRGWEQHVDLVVACEDALITCQRTETRNAARSRVASLLQEAARV